jgi:CRISPR-associated protein Csd2
MKRYDFVLLVDVTDGNPNGDPDADNQPRTDPETGHGLITDVCIKRKIRNYVGATRSGQEGYDIYVRPGAVLSRAQEAALKEAGADLTVPEEAAPQGKGSKAKSTPKRAKDAIGGAREIMCQRYFDIRAFGAVMAAKENSDRVCGPVQITFGRSIDPVVIQEHTLTRCAVANEKESEKKGGMNQTMGHKHTIPYGLYRFHGFVVPALADKTGFGEADLQVLWESLNQMFEIDRSAARGLMATRALIVFEHESPLGCARSHELFDLVKVIRVGEDPARRYSDYALQVGPTPPGVTVRMK